MPSVRPPRRALVALRAAAVVVLLALPACDPGGPYCSTANDITGRAVELCPRVNDEPVCDLEGDTARFESPSGEPVLVGGDEARCNADREITCPAGTVEPAYCITVPQ